MALPLLPTPTDLKLTTAIATCATVWLSIWQQLSTKGKTGPITTRKVIHITCGPALLALWPLYTSNDSRFIASFVPLLFVLRLIDSARRGGTLGKSLSRFGKSEDALQGPLVYALVLFVGTVALFRAEAFAIAVMQLCFGDAAAELAGRTWGKNSQWPARWTGDKSVVGSAAFVIAGWVGSVLMLSWWNYTQISGTDIANASVLLKLFVVSIACAAVELLPTNLVDDNLTIAVTAVTTSAILFGSGSLM